MERAIITISESGNVNIPTLKTAIQAIHKIGVIAEHTQHCEVMPYTYWATLYNIDMIVSLAFRINSYGAEKIRSEVLKRICGREEKVSAYRLISQSR